MPPASSMPRGICLLCAKTWGGTTRSIRRSGGHFWKSGCRLSESILMISGRGSFEIVQKAVAAGIPIVCAVSAPSSLAVDLARRFDQTLIGFLQGFAVQYL